MDKILCCPNEILSCYNNLILLFEQDDKLCKQDIKLFEQHIKSSEQVKKIKLACLFPGSVERILKQFQRFTSAVKRFLVSHCVLFEAHTIINEDDLDLSGGYVLILFHPQFNIF